MREVEENEKKKKKKKKIGGLPTEGKALQKAN